MLKRMAIIAGVVLSVAAIFMAVYYQQHNAIGKDYRLKCEQESLPSSTTASLVCKIESINETEQGKPGKTSMVEHTHSMARGNNCLADIGHVGGYRLAIVGNVEGCESGGNCR